MVSGHEVSGHGETQGRLIRFVFDELPVRGCIVRLSGSWRQLLHDRPYPSPIRDILGQALAAGPLLASNLKFDGRLSLQLQGQGDVKLLVAQVSRSLEVRGMARHEGVAGHPSLREMAGAGARLALHLEPSQPGAQSYQALVALSGDSLAHSLEGYFQQSEQLPTRLWLSADGEAAAGLMIQRMPAAEGQFRGEDWTRLGLLGDTVTDAELLALDPERVLRRLFHDEQVRVFPPESAEVVCRCAEGRIPRMLLALGRDEVEDILQEQGRVEVECGFCGRTATYGREEVDALFVEASSSGDGPSIH